MSYAYHPLSRVGAFTKGNPSVTTYRTQWDLWEHPVSQCPGCLASAASRCTCKSEARAAAKADKAAAIFSQAERAKSDLAKRQANVVRLHEELIERHLDRLSKIPAGMRGGYLSNVPKSIRAELLSYVA